MYMGVKKPIKQTIIDVFFKLQQIHDPPTFSNSLNLYIINYFPVQFCLHETMMGPIDKTWFPRSLVDSVLSGVMTLPEYYIYL